MRIPLAVRLYPCVVFLGALPSTVWGQSGCSAISFLNVHEEAMFSASGTVTAMVRETDGSYSGYPHMTYGPYTRSPAVNNFQSRFSACLPEPKKRSTALHVRGVPEGATSADVAVIRDAGNGTPAGIWKGFYGSVIQVWTGSLDYSYSAKTDYEVGTERQSLMAADFTGDGKADIAVLMYGAGWGSAPGKLLVLRGKGDGSFETAPVSTEAPPDPRSFCRGDFDGDGNVDVAVSSSTGVQIMPGNGDGSFRKGASIEFQYAYGVAASDVNRDGKKDLIVTSGQSKVAIFPGIGDGTFKAGETYPTVMNPQYAAIGDLNGDGNDDLAVAGLGNTVTIYLGHGNGTFSSGTDYVAGHDPRHLVLSDVNGDGNMDVVVGDGIGEALVGSIDNGYMSVLLGNGDGTFLSAPSYRLTNSLFSSVTADFNGDGRPDVALADSNGNVSLITRTPDGQFQPMGSAMQRLGNVLAAADLNGDGKTDLIAGMDRDTPVSVVLGGGNGTFQAPTKLTSARGTQGIAAVDLNGDKRVDLAVTYGSGSPGDPTGVRLFLQQENGTFQQGTDVNPGSTPRAIAAMDVTGDGKMDLLVLNFGSFASATDPGGLAILAGNGKGTFAAPVALAAGLNPSNMSVGDVNGDGRPDVVVSTGDLNYSNFVVVYPGTGTGLAPGVFLRTDFGPKGVAIADFSGDGKTDLVVAHCCGDTDMTYMLGNGDGTFQDEVHFAGGADPTDLVVSDFDGNGKPDLLVKNSPSGGASLTALMNNSPVAGAFAAVSAASFQYGPVAPDSIVAIFGNGLSTGTASTPSADLPKDLEGTVVSVEDSAGSERPAGLFSVSRAQVNFLLPPETAAGPATVKVTADGTTQTGTIDVANVAPGIFLLNASSLAAAQIQRFSGSAESWENVYAVNSGTGAVEAGEIDFGPDSDRLYLLLYCTGVRKQTSLGSVSVQVGGQSVPALFAGAQGQFPGLDQVNVELPRSLKGSGEVPVTVTIGGAKSNAAKLRFR